MKVIIFIQSPFYWTSDVSLLLLWEQKVIAILYSHTQIFFLSYNFTFNSFCVQIPGELNGLMKSSLKAIMTFTTGHRDIQNYSMLTY